MNSEEEAAVSDIGPERRHRLTRERQSMWTVRPTWVSPYFTLFTLQVIVGEAIIVWHEITRASHDSAYEAYVGIIQGIGWVGLAAAINTFIITETLEGAMVTAMWIRQRFLEPLKERQRAEGRVEGRAEGRAEGHAEGHAEGRAELIEQIKEWESRRRDAEARGETFDEPPPYSSNGHTNG